MALFVLDQELRFPPPHLAEPDGLLAMGGDLSPERLLLAYRMGIFPWYDSEPILWWSPDPRFVLFPAEIKVSKSMRPLFNRQHFHFTTNQAFSQVIASCRQADRPGQDGTWITGEVEKAYTRLHQLGHAVSAEVWRNGQLAGGLYGIRMGKVFFGESMFSLESNASKYAFISYVRQLQEEGVELIDCQVHTSYLEGLGARMIPGAGFRALLEKLVR
ncbi:MAG: leucyl/phenylalanyl-tRNA--protein transferase [Chitinophagaceae bacterium]|nr:MAG: leucyl/phenylalanyl-tRNA--protein transferase [Chitinophagaceae bacterium]